VRLTVLSFDEAVLSEMKNVLRDAIEHRSQAGRSSCGDQRNGDKSKTKAAQITCIGRIWTLNQTVYPLCQIGIGGCQGGESDSMSECGGPAGHLDQSLSKEKIPRVVPMNSIVIGGPFRSSSPMEDPGFAKWQSV
jgi:hypothetical protein